MSKQSTQTQRIHEYMLYVGPITPMDALTLFGCFRLGARIWDLRSQGIDIKTEFETKNGKTYARYRMQSQMEMAI